MPDQDQSVAFGNLMRALMFACQLMIGLVAPVVFTAYWRARRQWMIRKERYLAWFGVFAVSCHALSAAYDTYQKMDGPFRPTYAAYLPAYLVYIALLFHTSGKANRCITREKSEGDGLQNRPPAWFK